MYNLTIPIIPKRIHHEARRSESTPLKKQNRKLWEWLRECEYSIAPEKRIQKKTYVIKLGTLEVNKDDGDKESADEKIDWEKNIKKVEAETESMEVESASNLDKAKIGSDMEVSSSDSESSDGDDEELHQFCSTEYSEAAHTLICNFIRFDFFSTFQS